LSETPNRKPRDFDWIAARSLCSIQRMFEELKTEIRQDAEKINARANENIPSRLFRITERAKFLKVYEEDAFADYPPAVAFILSGEVIHVQDGENKEMFDITIGLNDCGDCQFVVSGKERDSWQVRRQALEGLFFRR
jgi:hypothetical protein